MTLNLNQAEEKLIPLTSLQDFSENLIINLNKKGASVVVAGILQAKNSDSVVFHIQVNHNAPQTVSDVLIRTVLEDKAVVNLTGLVKICQGAKNSHSFLKEDALILSPDAQAFAIPSLEILENEVKAGHSSFVGPVDPDQIFYLQSRGINLKQAEKMVVKGFLQPVKDKLEKRS